MVVQLADTIETIYPAAKLSAFIVKPRNIITEMFSPKTFPAKSIQYVLVIAFLLKITNSKLLFKYTVVVLF